MNFFNVRATLKNIKKDIVKNSLLPNYAKNTKVKNNILDTAIRLAVSNYKAALTNKKRGNIKNFRIRYWRYNKDVKIAVLPIKIYNSSNNLIYGGDSK